MLRLGARKMSCAMDKLVKLYKGDWHVKNLNSYNHLLHLLFG